MDFKLKVIACITILNILIIFPIFFHLSVIPRLEKISGIRFEFNRPGSSKLYFKRFIGVTMDVGLYISVKFLFLIMRRDWGKIKIRPYSSLQKINFPIQNASKTEIIFSLLYLINFVTLLITLILACIFDWAEIQPNLVRSLMHTRHHW
jgi:hypothetical protein